MLEVKNLSTRFLLQGRWTHRKKYLYAVDDVSLKIKKGEVAALVGESGSGKTTLGRSILRLEEPCSGSVNFDQTDILTLDPAGLRSFRPRMQLIFQDPYSSLNPRLQIRQIISEPLLLHGIIRKKEVDSRVSELLVQVGLDPYFMYRYPHEMSGGQRQRIAIARVIGMKPDFIIADEPVSALDMSVRAQILNLLNELQDQLGMAMLFITHDLSLARQISDRVLVMYQGKIVESATADDLFGNPTHPYTKRLLSAMPGYLP